MSTTPVTIGTVFGALAAHQRTAAMRAAIDLDLFTAIAEGAETAAALAARCGAAERGVRILADTLCAQGFLGKNGPRYLLAPGVELFLDRRSPGYMGAAAGFIAAPHGVQAFLTATDAVRNGGSVLPDDPRSPDHPMWVDFARSMGPIAAFQGALMAELLGASEAEPCKVLDIAAGHGEFGIAIAKRNPKAEVVALDGKAVLAVARENAEKAGVGSQVRELPGSALEVDYGTGYDLVLLTNFLHHFDEAGCETILRRVHAALKPGGRAVTLEFVPNADRTSPPEAATFAFVMLVMTPRGDAYTFDDIERMARNAGFAKSELHELPPSFHRVVISTR